jgi:hypothetical protein
MSGTEVDAHFVVALGLEMMTTWRLVNQRLETGIQPHELLLVVRPRSGCPWLVFGFW